VRHLSFLFLTLFAVACGTESSTPPTTASTPPAAEPATPTTPATPAPPVCTAAANRLCPVDEGANDASFVEFRNRLREAVRSKDEKALLELIDPKVRTSFGDGGGIEEFRAPDSKLLPELAKVLDLGGTFREGMFWAPYVYSAWPESIDAFEHLAAIRDSVPIRSNPSASAPVVATASWSILQLAQGREDGWLRVKTAEGVEGWVAAADVHSPVGYRAGFSKRSGKWLMEAFVAGD